MSKCLMLVFKLDLEHRIWQRFDDHGHHFNCIFLRQTVSFGKVGGWPLCFRNFLFFGWSLRLHPDMKLRALAHAASLIVPQNGAVFLFSELYAVLACTHIERVLGVCEGLICTVCVT